MYFVMANSNKKSFKVVASLSENDEIEIAKTEHFGFAIDIAKAFDESYESKGLKVLIEVR